MCASMIRDALNLMFIEKYNLINYLLQLFEVLVVIWYSIMYICEVEYVLFINMLYNSELYIMIFLVVICVGMGCNHELLNE